MALRWSETSAEPTGPEEEPEEVEGVFVIRGGKPEWAPVTLGIVGDWYFEILQGLQLGDSVVAGPYTAVRDLDAGAEIQLSPAATTPSADSTAENTEVTSR